MSPEITDKKGSIVLKGAREHNLQNIDLEIPQRQINSNNWS